MPESGKLNLLKGFILGLAASLLGLLATRNYFQHPPLEAPTRTTEHHRPDLSLPQAGLRKITSYSWIWVVTTVAAALIIGLGLLRISGPLLRPLGILLLAITLATALQPFVNILERRIPRAAAVVLVYLVLVLLFVGIGLVVIPPLVGQAQQVIDQIPDLYDRI